MSVMASPYLAAVVSRVEAWMAYSKAKRRWMETPAERVREMV
jgi:hypothetical protein